jgi:hypothetical protein
MGCFFLKYLLNSISYSEHDCLWTGDREENMVCTFANFLQALLRDTRDRHLSNSLHAIVWGWLLRKVVMLGGPRKFLKVRKISPCSNVEHVWAERVSEFDIMTKWLVGEFCHQKLNGAPDIFFVFTIISLTPFFTPLFFSSQRSCQLDVPLHYLGSRCGRPTIVYVLCSQFY